MSWRDIVNEQKEEKQSGWRELVNAESENLPSANRVKVAAQSVSSSKGTNGPNLNDWVVNSIEKAKEPTIKTTKKPAM